VRRQRNLPRDINAVGAKQRIGKALSAIMVVMREKGPKTANRRNQNARRQG